MHTAPGKPYAAVFLINVINTDDVTIRGVSFTYELLNALCYAVEL